MWFSNKPKPNDIGTVLLKMGVIDTPALLAAVAEQKAEGGMLGEVLIRLGSVRQDHVDKALVLQAQLRNGKRLDATIEIQQHNLKSALKRLTPAEVKAS